VTPFLTGYLASWVAFCLLAAGVALTSVRVSVHDAAAFLRAPWKLVLFVPAVVFVTFAGRFTDDETWDVVSGGGMALLTFLTSWWSVGVAVRALRRLVPLRYLVVALAVTLFSSSWFYDGYLLLRDGSYTCRWLGNLLLSPTIYLCAGVVLNLELRDGRVGVAFSRPDWPRPLPPSDVRAAWPLLLAAAPLVIVAGYFLVGFVGWRLSR
jgi:hypothetical protein